MHGLLAFLLVLLSTVFSGPCRFGEDPQFLTPRPDQLSLAGEISVALRLPPGPRIDTFAVTLDGVDVTDSFTVTGHVATGTVVSPAGSHELAAVVALRDGEEHEGRVSFETIDIEDPDCEILNAMHCALPYPSSHFSKPADTATGLQLAVPQVAIPAVVGNPVPAAIINTVDGFSPTVQPVMGFSKPVDLIASGLSRLRPVCLGSPEEDPECVPDSDTPWEGVRTHDDRSVRDPDHATVLLHWSGERVLHWAELDAAAVTPERQGFLLRPAESLIPGERYIVAVRRLVASDGTAIEAEAPFAALRDRRPTDIPQLVERRQRFERIFRRLARAGIDRDELVLAFDFTVQSDHQLTHQMLTMRDTALAWLAAQTQPTFTVDSVEEFDCSQPGQAIWKEIAGTYQSPLFLEALPVATNAPQHTVDGNDDPVMNGVMNPPYDLSIPCLAHPEFGDAEAEIHMLLLGHGIFGTGKQMVEGIPPAAALVMDHFEGAPAPDGGTRTTRRWNYIAGATNWTGWSGFADGARDGLWIAGQIIGFGPTSALENFPALPDRHRQGQLNTLVLSRLMKTGAFNAHPAFQSADGSGLLPTTAEQYYYGISMGGVQGLFQAALSQDIEKFGIDVGSMNFSFLLQRSTQFPIFDALLTNIGLSDPLDQLVGLGLLHELWVSADPAGYITHVTDPENLLPGNEFAKKIYLSPAWLDYQVSNHGTEATARTLGVASGPGSVQKELAAIPDAPSGTPLDSALIVWDTGLHDLLDPAGQASIPPLANLVVPKPTHDPHGARPFIPAGMQTLLEWAQPGGTLRNFCDDDGICNASQPWECRVGIDGTGQVVEGCP
ncbi:hypothetical protein KJ059_13310 [Myxococcota bacterium]|nr:hypothetical protein [Myxococcota bacterium]